MKVFTLTIEEETIELEYHIFAHRKKIEIMNLDNNHHWFLT